MEKLKAVAEQYFSINPDVTDIHVTTDEQIFKNDGFAILHAKSLSNPTVFHFNRNTGLVLSNNQVAQPGSFEIVPTHSAFYGDDAAKEAAAKEAAAKEAAAKEAAAKEAEAKEAEVKEAAAKSAKVTTPKKIRNASR